MKKNQFMAALLLPVSLLATAGLSHNNAPSRLFAQQDDSTQATTAQAEPELQSVIDEVIWVVGDEPILKSEVEITRLQGQAEGMTWDGDPDCRIPEQIAVQKLFLHQAALDSIEVTEAEINQGVDQQINYWLSLPTIDGSRERLEQYQRKSISQMRQDMHDDFRDRQLVQKMQQELVKDIEVTPAEVRAFFKDMPKDSLPEIPTTVEVQILTQNPKIETEEINRIKNQLREFTDRVTKKETSFSTLARLYSEDKGSARMGGELGFTGRGLLDPAFANVAFNLTDPNKVSKIVETEFGYHIIQLIDRRGDKINARHILLRPRVSDESVEAAKLRLDSIGDDIRAGKFSFGDATAYLSDDKDTKANHGIMVNSTESARTSRFRMQDLPTEVAAVIDTMKVGEVSRAFRMVTDRGKVTTAIVRLMARTDAHRATITEDFQAMSEVVLSHMRQKKIHDWVVKKVKDTYVWISPLYRGCNFEYEGWVR